MALESTFIYVSINTSLGDIRAMNIHPGDQADDLNLTFDVVRILNDSKLDFEAISYRWGSPEGRHLVQLNGRLFPITSSQNQMIRNLRDVQNIRRVWIDALCINQKDIAERKDQVQLMRKVFGYARSVSIYLDSEIDESGPAYRKFLTFTSDCKIEDLLEEESIFWRQICNALQSEYFERVWVQQEMSVARQLALQCRRTPRPITCLLHFIGAWSNIGYQTFQGDLKDEPGSQLFENPSLGFYRLLGGVDSPFTAEPLDFIQLLCLAKDLKCTDERDRIYGVMFLAQGWQEGNLIANYSLTVPEVFREAMISYLRNYGSISFLEHAYFSYEKFENLKDRTPSWVPDWRKRP
jgi:hypothetical protein